MPRPPRHARAAVLALLAALLAALGAAQGCTEDGGDPADPAGALAAGATVLTTDRSAYTPAVERGTYRFTVVATFRNGTRDTLFLPRCYPDSPIPVFGVQLDAPADARGSAASSAFDPAWACVGHDRQLAVAPGATRVDTLRLVGPTATDGITGLPLGMLAGRMRLVYGARTRRGDAAYQVPDPVRSAPFDVRLE